MGQKLALEYDLDYNKDNNDYGYVNNNEAGDSIHFSQRNLKMIQNVVEVNYTFNNRMSIRLRGRHYWSSVSNKDYYLLGQDGTLAYDKSYTENHDTNFNSFNIDMVLRWVFAPGSEMTVGWKNAIFDSNENVMKKYRDNWKILRTSPQTNTFSLKILYYLDYNNIIL